LSAQHHTLCASLFQQLRRFPTLQAAIATAANEALERFREDGRSTALRLVDMEAAYVTVEFFRKLPQDPPADAPASKAGGKPSAEPAAAPPPDRYGDGHFRSIASNVSQYIRMVGDELLQKIPKAAVHCQVREAKRSLLNHFYVQMGKKEVGATYVSITWQLNYSLSNVVLLVASMGFGIRAGWGVWAYAGRGPGDDGAPAAVLQEAGAVQICQG
jgi:hypothetical protein